MTSSGTFATGRAALRRPEPLRYVVCLLATEITAVDDVLCRL